jgi:hypothetical protein
MERPERLRAASALRGLEDAAARSSYNRSLAELLQDAGG